MTQLFRGGFALAIALLAPVSAHATGVIRGIVRVPVSGSSSSSASDPYPGRAGSLPGVHGPARGRPGDTVIYVERLPAATESTLARGRSVPKLSQKDQSFVPRVLPIGVGDAVDFPNLDPIFHNVFSLSPVRRFDLGKYPRGQSKRLTFTRRGLVNVYCDIHSDMAAFILVLPHHGFTQPDLQGRYAMPALPPGRYTLHAWHPDLTEQRREVDVPARGDVTLDLDL